MAFLSGSLGFLSSGPINILIKWGMNMYVLWCVFLILELNTFEYFQIVELRTIHDVYLPSLKLNCSYLKIGLLPQKEIHRLQPQCFRCYCWWKKIWLTSWDVVYPIIYIYTWEVYLQILQCFKHPRWLFGISSINSMLVSESPPSAFRRKNLLKASELQVTLYHQVYPQISNPRDRNKEIETSKRQRRSF